MKKITLVLAMLILTAAFAAGPCAAEPATDSAATKKDQKKTGKKAVKKTGTYVGEVMEIDQKSNKIVVAPKNSEIAMVLNTSKVKKGLDEVKVGDWVEATFEAKVGTLYALKVTKTKKPEESKKSGLKKDAPRQKPANHP